MISREILIFILLPAVTLAKGIRSSCKVEKIDTSAFIVCNFSIDISKVRNDFQVDHLQGNDSLKRQETVFMCERTQGKTEYKNRPGYELQGTVSRTVTLKIPKLSQEHEGQYMCAVIPSDPTEIELCDLPSKEIVVGVPVRKDIDKRISDESSVSPKNSSKDGTDSHPSLLVIIGVSVAGTVVVFIIVIVSIIFYRIKKAQNQPQPENSENPKKPMLPQTV